MLPVVIVGGGISGLSAAYFLERYAAQAGRNVSPVLIESQNRLGGVILTERSGGFLLEGGPDSFLAQKPAGVDLCRALGLSGQLISSNDRQRKTYILHRGRMREIPDGLMFLAPTRLGPVLRSGLFSLSGKLRLACSPWVSPSPLQAEDVSVAEFLSQRFGREVLERLAEPLLSAIYGADVDSLSARAALPQFVALEEKYGSLWQGIQQSRRQAAAKRESPASETGLFTTLRNGLEELIAALQRSLKKTALATGRHVVRVCPSAPANCFRVEWDGGGMDAAAVILATPAHATARLVREMDPPLAGVLDQIRYHSSVIVALGFAENFQRRPFDGFGFVVPRRERTRLIACTSVSTKFPFRSPPGQLLLRCFLGGSRDPSILEADDRQVVETTLSELRRIAALPSAPVLARVYRWEKRMPQYDVGHPLRCQQMASHLERHPGLYITGNGYFGIGLPDCIQSSSQAASAAFQYLQAFA